MVTDRANIAITNMKSHMCVRLPYLDLTLAYAKSQLLMESNGVILWIIVCVYTFVSRNVTARANG